MSTNVTEMLAATSETLTQTIYVDGDATDLGTVTVDVTRAAGTVIASGAAVTDNADGTYEYTITPAVAADPDFLTIDWNVDDGQTFTSYVEIVGNTLTHEAAVRAYDGAALANTTTYTDAAINKAILDATRRLEQWTGRSWVERYARALFAGTGTRTINVYDARRRTHGGPGQRRDIQRVLAADDGAAITVSNIVVDDDGNLTRTDASWTRPTSSDPLNVEVGWVYGLPWVVDGADEIVMALVREQLVPSDADYGGRATSFSTDLFRVNFETPGRAGNVSTLPEVNEWVKAHNHKLPIG